MISRLEKKTLVRLGLAALIVRFLYFIQHLNSPFFARPLLDQRYYELCARQLAGMGGELISGFRPLLYPAFLSIFCRLDPEGGILWAIVIQHLFGVLMTLLIAIGTSILFKNASAGIAAGILFCLSGPPLFFEGKLLITTLFSLLLLLFLLSVLWAIAEQRATRAACLWLLAGILLGFSAQARPNALPLALSFPAVSIYRWLFANRKMPFARRRSFPTVQALMPILAVPALLTIQLVFAAWNTSYSNSFSLTPQAGGINFYLGNYHKADGMIPRQDRHVVYEGSYRDPIQEMSEQVFREVTGTTGAASPVEVSAFWKRRAFAEIKADPARWLGLMVKKTWLMLWSHEVPNNFSLGFAAMHDTPILRWLPIHWWLLLALFPWGIHALLQAKQHETILVLLSFLALFASTIILFFVNSRYRVPLWPCMAMIAGGGTIRLYAAIKTYQLPLRTSLASAFLLALSLINWFGIPPDPIENDLSMRANALYENGRNEEALLDINQCIEAAPGNPRYHFIRGNVLLAQNLHQEAIASFLKAISLNANDPRFHNNLGLALEHAGYLSKAETAYSKALQLRPTDQRAQMNLALLAIRTGNLKQAEQLLNPLLRKRPDDVLLRCAQAVLTFKKTGDDAMRAKAIDLHETMAQQLLH
jgi:tetratricopeptide (TPR) repeat protein